MNIASRITEMEQHIGNAYDKIEDLGIDLTNVDKNINNISSMLEDVWDEYPKVTATDVEEATLNGTKKGRMEIDLKGQTEQNTVILPSEYQQVEYIESTGTQYIDTGILTNNNIEVDIQAIPIFPSPLNYNLSLIGGRKSSNDSNFSYTGGSGNDFVGKGEGFLTITKNTNKEMLYLKYNNNYISVKCGNYSYINNELNINITNSFNLYLFAMNQDNSANSLGTYQLYSCKIYSINNILVRNFIPCYRTSDNEIGLYDTVTNTFFINQGTGTFLKGNNATLPNPNFPQPIKNVTGQANVKIQNKNLFNVTNFNTTLNGITITRTDNKITLNGTAVNLGAINLYDNKTANYVQYIENATAIRLKAGTYTLSLHNITGTQNDIYCNLLICKKITEIPNTLLSYFSIKNETSASFTINEESDIYFGIQWIGNKSFTNFSFNIQIEQGSTATSYVPHQEQNLPFTFAEGQRAMQGTTLEDDGIHNTWKQKVLNGTEDWTTFGIQSKFSYYMNLSDGGNNNDVKCSHFKNQINVGIPDANRFVYNASTNKNILFNRGDTEDKLADWKAWLAEQYQNGTPVIVEYELAEEEIILYNSTQQSQYNAIKQAKSYDDQTNISSTSTELGFKMDVESLRNKTN